MTSPEQQEQLTRLAPLLAREGVDVWSASADEFDAGMKRAKQRLAAAAERVRAVLLAHARGDVSAAGALLEALEEQGDATPPPIPDALTVASRFAQVVQSVAATLPKQAVDRTFDRARTPDAPEGMEDMCTAVLLNSDASAGLNAVVREYGIDSALYASAAMASNTFSLWAHDFGADMETMVNDHA